MPTTLEFSAESVIQKIVSAYRDLDNLVRWSEEWQMLFNVGKCKVMHLGRANMNKDYYMNSKKGEYINGKRLGSNHH